MTPKPINSWILSERRRAAALLSVCTLTGCSVGGSWRTTEIQPSGAPFPIQELTLDENGKYTATGLFSAQGKYDGDAHTTTGAYQLSGQTLHLSPIGGPALEYRTRRRADGKLVLTFKPPGQDRAVTAVLEPVAAPK